MMDSMDVNKAVAAALVAGIAFFVTGLIGDNLIYETPPAKSPISIQGVQPAASTGGAAQPAELPPVVPLLASADPEKGHQFASQVCAACHSFNKGGKPIVGPNLYGILGAPHDHEAGFDYSAALEKFKGQPWTYDALNHWLDDPQTYAPGTRMTYTGVKNDQMRANVIDYLRSLSDNPEPLPKPEAPAKAATAAPAPGSAAPAGNQSAPSSAATPNSAPASSPKVAAPPGASDNAAGQAANTNTSAGGTGAAPATPTAPTKTP